MENLPSFFFLNCGHQLKLWHSLHFSQIVSKSLYYTSFCILASYELLQLRRGVALDVGKGGYGMRFHKSGRIRGDSRVFGSRSRLVGANGRGFSSQKRSPPRDWSQLQLHLAPIRFSSARCSVIIGTTSDRALRSALGHRHDLQFVFSLLSFHFHQERF